MPNEADDPQVPRTHGKVPTFVQIPVPVIHRILSLKLTGAQHDLLLYLWTLDPYGDRWVELPSPEEIALLLKADPRTIQRAAQRLDDCELFEFQIKRWKVRNIYVSAKTRENSTGKEIRIATKRSKRRQKDPKVANGIKLSENGQNDPNVVLEAAQGATSESLHTIHTDPYSFISEREMGSEQVVKECFEVTEDDSLKITAEYEKWLRKKGQQLPTPPVLIERWIESEAVSEANQRQFLQERSSNSGVGFPLSSRIDRFEFPPSPPNRFEIETSCDQALLRGDRVWVLAKLQQLWRDGWHEPLEELLALRQDWGFVLSDQGVNDAT